MTSLPPIAREAEALVRQLADDLTRPHEHECLCCYVARMLDQFPCDGSHRHAERYRDAAAPRATALLDRLSRVGACCCDCELFLNGYLPRILVESRDLELELDYADLPACSGVRRGSIRPCSNWVRLRRGGW